MNKLAVKISKGHYYKCFTLVNKNFIFKFLKLMKIINNKKEDGFLGQVSDRDR